MPRRKTRTSNPNRPHSDPKHTPTHTNSTILPPDLRPGMAHASEIQTQEEEPDAPRLRRTALRRPGLRRLARIQREATPRVGRRAVADASDAERGRTGNTANGIDRRRSARREPRADRTHGR